MVHIDDEPPSLVLQDERCGLRTRWQTRAQHAGLPFDDRVQESHHLEIASKRVDRQLLERQIARSYTFGAGVARCSERGASETPQSTLLWNRRIDANHIADAACGDSFLRRY